MKESKITITREGRCPQCYALRNLTIEIMLSGKVQNKIYNLLSKKAPCLQVGEYVSGISKTEILEGMGFIIKNNRLTQDGIVYCLDSDGNQIYPEDVLAVVSGKNNELRLITDISDLEDDE